MPVPVASIRSSNSYFGFSKESTPGTPAAPTIFPRWQNGSKIDIDLNTEDIREGDSSRRLSTIIKNKQMVKVKLVAALRPNELGFFETAAQGSGSDTYTAPTVATTLSALTTAGATSITVTANTGLTGAGTITLVLEAGTATEEVAIFNVPATGVGPYTLAVNSGYNGGALKLAHANAGTVKSSASHVITDQSDGDYYTIEVGLGNQFGAAGTALRVRSCKVSSFKRSAESGKLLMHEIEFTGIASSVQGTPATVTLEQHQSFLFTQSVWTVDGVTTGDALNLTKFDIEQNNGLDDDMQTEGLVNAGLVYGNLDFKVSFAVLFTVFSKVFQTYYGSASGATDAQALGLGSLEVTFTQPDGLHSVKYKILTLAYTKTNIPEPKTDGKHFEMSVEGKSIAAPLIGAGANNAYLLQTTLTNTQFSAY